MKFRLFEKKEKQVVQPAFPGTVNSWYYDILEKPHVLIAGSTGSGKSVLLNGLVYTLLHCTSNEKQFFLIDPKRIELQEYKHLPHCLGYANTIEQANNILEQAIAIMENRFQYMETKHIKKYPGSDIYILIDEYADLSMNKDYKKQIESSISRLAALARATRIHLIVCTQRPTRDIVTGMLKTNIPDRIGLRCPTKQDSRNIINFAGCEKLPECGYGYFLTSNQTEPELHKIPYIDDQTIGKAIAWYIS